MLTVTVTALFGMSIQPLMAGLAKDVFLVDEAGLGTLVSSVGVSAAITSIVTVGIADRISRSMMIRVGLLLYGVGLLIVASTQVFAIAIGGFIVVGFAHVLVNVSVSTAIQVIVPDAFPRPSHLPPAHGDHRLDADRRSGWRPHRRVHGAFLRRRSLRLRS